jgi:predicted nucleotidyltransferase
MILMNTDTAVIGIICIIRMYLYIGITSMLKDRITDTLKFFDLQNWPLTLVELHRFLIADMEALKAKLDSKWELRPGAGGNGEDVPLDKVLLSLDSDCRNFVSEVKGFYCVKGREKIIHDRIKNYAFGLRREKLIKKYTGMLRHVPFVRGVALGGSQAMGNQKEDSDIDLLIITDKKFLFLGRLFVTLYFQLTGKRRHGKLIVNRFCLNHYLSWPKPLTNYQNLYTAMEYGRLRPLVYGQSIFQYQKNNEPWIRQFFPSWQPAQLGDEGQSKCQKAAEMFLNNPLGLSLEKIIGKLQLAKIENQEFIVVLPDELSFHPDSKQQYLLEPFFQSR